jgi:type I site-specific restriction-modification system R (restriction) subunit
MGLLDGFEKLINEHGSAVILKERIALANDKYTALEQKLSECAAAKLELESENKALRLNLEKATIEIQNLKKLSEHSQGPLLEEIQEDILRLLAQRDETIEPIIWSKLGIGEQLAKFHLSELATSKLVTLTLLRVAIGRPNPPSWRLTQEGRRYLVTRGLLA